MTLTTRVRRAAAAVLAAVAGAAVQAAPADTLAQRLLACTACHGKDGRAAADGYYPRIAGKPAGYLLEQLHNFRDGRRAYLPMKRLLDPLSDAYLREIAEYFAGLDLPYPPPQAPSADAATLRRGETLARHGDPSRELPACARCHGTALSGVAPAVPGLLGLPHDYLNAQLGAWRGGNRSARAPDCMATIARQLAPGDIAAIAQWLAAQPVAAHGKPAEAPPGDWPLRCGSIEAPVR